MICRPRFLSAILMAAGAGMLLSLLLPSAFWKVLVGLVLLILGYAAGKTC